MKFFAFIMACLVLVLSCLPCADAAFSINAYKPKSELVKATSQQNNADHSDDCSPFCQCSCCTGFSLSHTFTAISDPLFDSRKLFLSYLPANLIEISLPIWQPPQLS